MHHIDEWEIRDAVARPMRLAAGTVLRVSRGRVWLTWEHGREDIWLLPAAEWRAAQPMRAWLSADPTATLQRLTPIMSKPWAGLLGRVAGAGAGFQVQHPWSAESVAPWR